MKKKLVVDLDNTLTIEDGTLSYEYKLVRSDLVKKLQEYQDGGYEIIVYTSRRMQTHDNDESKVVADIADTTIRWLNKHSIPFDGLRFGKPFAKGGFYIDDHTIRPSEFLRFSEEEIQEIFKAERKN